MGRIKTEQEQNRDLYEGMQAVYSEEVCVCTGEQELFPRLRKIYRGIVGYMKLLWATKRRWGPKYQDNGRTREYNVQQQAGRKGSKYLWKLLLRPRGRRESADIRITGRE